MTLQYVELMQATNVIGESLVNLVSPETFEHRRFPYPGFGELVYQPELPSIICRWDGIAEDRESENELIRVPSVLRFEVRITNVSTYPPQGVDDAYTHAQNNVLSGTSEFFSKLAEDRTLDGQVLDVGMESSIVADLLDPLTDEEFYGHQMVLNVRLFV